MKNNFLHIINISIFALTLLSSCKQTQLLNKDEYLLKSNRIQTDKANLNKEEINSYIKQQPNRKILWAFRFHLGVYNLGSKPFPEDIRTSLENTPLIKRFVPSILKTDSIYKHNLRTIIGEAPVILDTSLSYASSGQIQLYLANKGYFNSVVTPVIKKYKRKKASVTYSVVTPEPYYIGNINITTGGDNVLTSLLLSNSKNSYIRKGDIYDIDNFENERSRITKILKNEGYYLFSKDYIVFRIDSATGQNRMDVEINIRKVISKAINNPDSLVYSTHKRFTINKIWLYPGCSNIPASDIYNDTTIIKTQRQKKEENRYKTYYFVHNGKINIKPTIITQSVFINSGNYFNLDDANRTYNRLSELRNFRRITIQFDDVSDSAKNENLLDCKIFLPLAMKQAFSVETEGTNSGGNLGIAGVIQYENKNLFGGAEIFNFKIKGQAAAQKVIGETQEQSQNAIIPLNTIEAGGEAKILFPRFLVPVKPERFSKSFRPKTTITAGYNYQKRPDYTRYIANTAFGYEWRESAIKKHIFTPLELNLVKIYPSEAFQQQIDAIQNIKIKNTYQDHLITTIKYNYIRNTQSISKTGNFSYLKFGFEPAFNLFKFKNLSNGKNTQYVINDLDFRRYIKFYKKSQLVSRIHFGIGLPYGKATVLPFEKSFYTGGANSIRAWQLKTLGPGAFSDSLGSSSLDRIGDICLELNLEYRFPVYSFLNGAIFIDAGNVWLKNRNKEFLNGNFEFSRAPGEIAIGTGLGARFDFGFFIVRIDGGIPVKDPSMPKGDRWVIKNFKTNNIIGNLGIGYPF